MDALTARTANIMLDMLSVQGYSEDEAANHLATRTAFESLQSIGAVTAGRDDETDAVTLDLSPVLLASGALLSLLIQQIVEAENYDRDDLFVAMRHVLDVLAEDGPATPWPESQASRPPS